MPFSFLEIAIAFALVRRIVSVSHYKLLLVIQWLERGVRRRELVLSNMLDVVPLCAVVHTTRMHMNRSTVPLVKDTVGHATEPLWAMTRRCCH